MTIAITTSGIALDGPLVAGEKVAVYVSGLSLAAEDKPTLALLARFPDALLASVELAESETAGTWTGELDTATKQTALFFATARADERRDAALELVAGRVSLARLTVPMANSALCPKPDGSPFASPVYVPVPGPPGQGGDPYDQAPQMDGEASAGTADEYARGDHRHPTDTTRQAVVEDLAAIRSGAAAGATAVQPSALSAYRTASAQDAIDGAQDTAIAAKYTKPATGIPASDIATGVIPSVPSLPISIANGGTGATSKNAALANLGAVKKSGDTMTGDLEVQRTSGSYTGGTVSVRSVPDGSGEALVKVAATDGAELYLDAASGYNPSIAVKRAGGELKEIEVPANTGTLALQEGVAPAFSASSTYAVGDYVTHEGLLYKCTTAVSTAGAWNAANWSAVSAMAEMPAPITVDSAMSSSSTNPVQNKVVDGAVKGRVPWANGTKNAVTVGERDGTWQIGEKSFTVGANVAATANHSFAQGQANYAFGQASFAEGQGGTAAGFASHTAGRRAVSAGGTGQSASPAHDYAWVWQGASSQNDNTPYYHSHGNGTFNINPVPASGSTDPATGFWIDETKLSDYVRYAFASPTPSVSGTAATVACEDRAINDFTVATGITSLTITPPAAVTGRARDFFCRVTLTDASLPTVTLSGATIDIGASEVAGMTQGVNLLMFTEIASGHWLASRRSAS
jgi:hypothetical protein